MNDLSITYKVITGEFEVVSKENYENIISLVHKDMGEKSPIFVPYEEIKLPRRATNDSAGYDFFLPHNIHLDPGESFLIHTMIRVKINTGWVLMTFPKSGLSYKYNTQLANTVGIVDGDYYNSKTDDYTNEGQMTVKLINRGNKVLELSAGSKFVQGVFLPYGITMSDDNTPKKTRNGGFGSTGI